MKKYKYAAVVCFVVAGISLIILLYEMGLLSDFNLGWIFPFWKKRR